MYVTPEYYTDTHKGNLIPQEELERSLLKAERTIDHLCFGRIKGKGFDNLTPFQQNLIKDAICLQADYIKEYGEFLTSPMKGYSVGSTKVELSKVTCNGMDTTQEIINLLEDTGLRCLML